VEVSRSVRQLVRVEHAWDRPQTLLLFLLCLQSGAVAEKRKENKQGEKTGDDDKEKRR
jgi:hypothetical protein